MLKTNGRMKFFKILIMSGILLIVSARVLISYCGEPFKRSEN